MKPETNCIFNYSGSGWHPIQKFNGQKVKIRRQLGPDETDEENEMYEVKAENGSEFQVFVDELTEILKYEKAAPFTLWQVNALYDVSANLDFIDSFADESDDLLSLATIEKQRKINGLCD